MSQPTDWKASVATSYRESSVRALAQTLRECGRLSDFWVPLDTGTFQPLRQCSRISHRIAKFSDTRSYFPPGQSVAVLSAITHQLDLMRSMPVTMAALKRSVAFDEAVAEQLSTTKSSHFVGMPYSNVDAFSICAARGITSVLNQVNGLPDVENEALLSERDHAAASRDLDEIQDELWPCEIIVRNRAEIAIASKIIVPSNLLAAHLHAHGIPPRRTIVSSYGAVLGHHTIRRRSPKEPLRLLYAGQVGYRKGLRYLLLALRSKDAPPFSLKIVGPIMNKNSILSRYGGQEYYAGTLDAGALGHEYREAHLLMLPTLSEGMARVVLEAMATGLPAVTTLESGYGDLIEDTVNGFIVRKQDPDALLNCLNEIYDNPDVIENASSLALTTARDCTWDAFGARVVSDLSIASCGDFIL